MKYIGTKRPAVPIYFIRPSICKLQSDTLLEQAKLKMINFVIILTVYIYILLVLSSQLDLPKPYASFETFLNNLFSAVSFFLCILLKETSFFKVQSTVAVDS